MCFNSRSDSRLPPLYYDGTQLSYTDTFKYLGMVCDKNIIDHCGCCGPQRETLGVLDTLF